MGEEVELCVEIGSNMNEPWVEKANINELCRACANTHANMIPIFEGDGLEHDLKAKIDKHFPVTISKNDGLPHRMCFQCASTLVAWHDMFTGCIDAEKKLKNLLKISKEDSKVVEEALESSVSAHGDLATEKLKLEQNISVEMDVEDGDDDDDDDDDDHHDDDEEEDAEEDEIESEEVVLHKLDGKKKENAVEIGDKETTIRDQCLTMSASPSSSAFKTILPVKSEIMCHSNKCLEDNREPFFCMYCGRMFVAEKELWTHINQDHLNLVNAFSCSECNQTFQTESELNTHLSKTDTNSSVGDKQGSSLIENIISCNKCRVQFPKKILLHQHNCSIREYVGSGFACNICANRFTRLTCIQFHLQRKHGIPCSPNLKCIDCEVIFKSLSELETHRLIEHGNMSSSIQSASGKSQGSTSLEERAATIVGKWFNEDDSVDDDYNEDADVDDKNQDHDYINKNKLSEKEEKSKKNVESACEDNALDSSTESNSLLCSLCLVNYKTKPHLFNHFKFDHSPEEAEGDALFLSMRNDYFCAPCYKYFARKTSLSDHKKKFHSSETPVCSLCSVKFENKLDLFNHLNTDHTLEEAEKDPQYLFIKNTLCCDICSKYFARKGSLMRHTEKFHSFEKFACTLCPAKFVKKDGLYHHLQTAHPPEEVQKHPLNRSINNGFSCDLCSKYFARKAGLLKHNERFHGQAYAVRKRGVKDNEDERLLKVCEVRLDDGLIVYKCSYCDKNIMTKRGFVRHVRIHTGERPFTCHICGKQYRSSTDLCRHLRCVHEGIKNYSCDICGRSFANKGSRNDHRRIHTGERPYVCHTCGKSFPTPNSIYLHRRTHTNYFPHKCTSCDKCFRRRQQLTHHMRTHTGEKPHSCDLCGKCFGVKDEVTRHRLTHSKEKPFQCPVCKVFFAQKRYVRNHMKAQHSQKKEAHVEVNVNVS